MEGTRRPSLTAAGVAAVRARLPRPVSPAGIDHAAYALAADLGVRVPLHRSRTAVGYLAGRTRFFDAVVADAATRPGTVVLVGAGYDDRAVRFRAPDVRFVEVDHPATQRDKCRRLDRLGIDVSDVAFVAVDLERDALDEILAGVAPSAPVTFVCEAVLPYLSPRRVEAVLAALARCPGAGRLAADLPLRPAGLAGRAAVAALGLATAIAGEPVRTVIGTEADLAALLRRAGWVEATRRTGRDLRMPLPARDLLFVELTPAEPRSDT